MDDNWIEKLGISYGYSEASLSAIKNASGVDMIVSGRPVTSLLLIALFWLTNPIKCKLTLKFKVKCKHFKV